jgi:hypothetical protein
MEQFLVRRLEFASFDSWPANAQLATLSMCWTLGPTFKFPNFQRHAAQQNWPGCAEECAFGPHEGTIIVRNALDREHFLLSQRVADEGQPAELIALDITTVFGVQGALLALGFKPGRQDGADGPATRSAVSAFETAEGLTPTESSSDPGFLAALAARLSEAGFNPLPS